MNHIYLSIRVLHLLQYVGFEDRETTHFSTLLVISESSFRSTKCKNVFMLVMLISKTQAIPYHNGHKLFRGYIGDEPLLGIS